MAATGGCVCCHSATLPSRVKQINKSCECGLIAVHAKREANEARKSRFASHIARAHICYTAVHDYKLAHRRHTLALCGCVYVCDVPAAHAHPRLPVYDISTPQRCGALRYVVLLLIRSKMILEVSYDI